jgi:polyribonucleotide nucleotidyltransferase
MMMQSSGSRCSPISFLGVVVVFLLNSSNPVEGFQIKTGPSLSTLSRSSARDFELSTSTALKESPYYSIEKNNSGPAGGDVHRLTIHKLPGQKEGDENENPIVIETGKIGRQASGAVTLQRGDTVLYATAACDDKPKEGLDFLPLSVEHQERFSSVGLTSGGYNKRDGRPAEHEILTCRLIDRPIRPLVADGWRHETQLLSWVMSYDGLRSCDPLAIVASSTALYISEVPLTTAVAAAMVGFDKETETFILNPTIKEMEKSPLQLIVAGTKDAVLMIEGAADFMPEETMVRAVTFAHDAVKVICEAVEELGKVAGKEKNFSTLKKSPEGLQEIVNELMTEKVDAAYALGGTKTTQGPVMSELKKELIETLTSNDDEEAIEYEANDIKSAFKDLLCRRMYERAKTTGKRCDGRELDEIRHLSMETGFLPKTHGSALFTRGETQAIATTVSRPKFRFYAHFNSLCESECSSHQLLFESSIRTVLNNFYFRRHWEILG